MEVDQAKGSYDRAFPSFQSCCNSENKTSVLVFCEALKVLGQYGRKCVVQIRHRFLILLESMRTHNSARIVSNGTWRLTKQKVLTIAHFRLFNRVATAKIRHPFWFFVKLSRYLASMVGSAWYKFGTVF